VSQILCYHCFAKFPPRALHFKCIWHAVDDPVLGPGSPMIFHSGRWFGPCRPPKRVVCPVDHLLTSDRVCPDCHHDLPYYVGRSSQRVVSIAGCQGSGKTVYLWGLLYRLRERLARDEHAFASAMFEDDASARFYYRLSEAILRRGELPEATQAVAQRRGEIRPVIVRLLRPGRRPMSNLVFYDHAGELIEAMDDVRYLRHLAHSASIIYLVDPTGGGGRRSGDEANRLAAEALGHLGRQIRAELGLGKHERIAKRLAVVISKADVSITPRDGAEAPSDGLGDGQDCWRRWNRAGRAELDRASRRCEDLARDLGLDACVNAARLNFTRVRFFLASSLGRPFLPGTGGVPPEPMGVEHPLFWALTA